MGACETKFLALKLTKPEPIWTHWSLQYRGSEFPSILVFSIPDELTHVTSSLQYLDW